MKFIELPESGHLINLDHLLIVEHEVIGDKTVAIARFSNDLSIQLKGKDADNLITFIQNETYE